MNENILGFVSELIALIKACELERANQAVRDALDCAQAADHAARQQTVHEATLALYIAKRQRQRLFDTIEGLPEHQKRFAVLYIQQISQELFDREICALQARKRALSRPPR